MEKEVLYHLYHFEVLTQNKRWNFYFDDKRKAELARFSAYKCFDGDRISVKGFTPPVSRVKKVALSEREMKNIKVLNSYHEFELDWFDRTEEFIAEQ